MRQQTKTEINEVRFELAVQAILALDCQLRQESRDRVNLGMCSQCAKPWTPTIVDKCAYCNGDKVTYADWACSVKLL